MKFNHFLFFLLLSFTQNIFSQTFYTQKKLHSINGTNIPFSLLYLNCDSFHFNLPLILFLHGAGERGNDNQSQLTIGLPKLIENIKTPCLIVAPQCPKNEKWVNTDWTLPSHTMEKNCNTPLSACLQIIDSLLSLPEKIDSGRVYLTGLSMGGFGTWELLQRYPKKFSAAIPICGGGDLKECKSLTKIPIWAFHGKKDKLVPVSRTVNMISCIQKNGGISKMEIMEKAGHLCWNEVYKKKEVVSWLMSQKK